MKSLLLVAHGSRRRESNEEIAQVANSLCEQVQDQFECTQHAFLELAEPSIPEAIEQLISQGATEVLILPYFLSAGRHVHEDVPGIIQAKQKEHQNVTMHIAPYLGESEDMIALLAKLSTHGGSKV